MKFIGMTSTLCAVAVVMMTSIASAKPKGPADGKGLNPARIDRLAERLNIDETVVAKIKKVVYAAHALSIDKRAATQKARLNLQRLMDDEKPNRKSIMDALDTVGRLETDMRKHRVGMLLDVSALLTPVQRRGFKRLMRRLGKKQRAGNRGRFGGPDHR